MSSTNLPLAADCYRLLAACFHQPERSLFLEESLCPNIARLLGELAPEAIRHAEEMAHHLQQLDQHQLDVDYAALFVGPFRLLAAPYGSVYLEGQRTVMGVTTMQARHFYEKAGLKVEVDEPPDHIAIELEFISFLLNREAAAGSPDEAAHYRLLRRSFLEEALLTWVFDFCRELRRQGGNGFYTSLGDCLESFMHAERQRLLSVPAMS